MIVLKLISAIFVAPPVITYIVFRIMRRPIGNRRRAVHLAADWTSILYIVAVTYILSDLIGYSIGAYMLIMLILVLAILLTWQYRSQEEVALYRVLRQFMRSTFLIFFCLYFLLAILWITLRII